MLQTETPQGSWIPAFAEPALTKAIDALRRSVPIADARSSTVSVARPNSAESAARRFSKVNSSPCASRIVSSPKVVTFCNSAAMSARERVVSAVVSPSPRSRTSTRASACSWRTVALTRTRTPATAPKPTTQVRQSVAARPSDRDTVLPTRASRRRARSERDIARTSSLLSARMRRRRSRLLSSGIRLRSPHAQGDRAITRGGPGRLLFPRADRHRLCRPRLSAHCHFTPGDTRGISGAHSGSRALLPPGRGEYGRGVTLPSTAVGPQLQLLIFVVWVYLLFSNQVLPAWVEVVRAAARGGTLSGITLLCAV